MKRWLLAALIALTAKPVRAGSAALALPAGFDIPALRLVPVQPLQPALIQTTPLRVNALPAAVAAELSRFPAFAPPPAIALPAAAVPRLAASLAKPVLKDSPSLRSGVANDEAAPAARAGALPSLHAAAADAGKALGEGASAAASRELSAKAFDGGESRGAPPADGAAGDDGPAPAVLPPYLAAPDAKQAAWFAEVIAAAQASKTSRAVLAKIEKLAAERGRPVVVRVAPIGNSGEYAYDHELVTMDASFKREPAEFAAVILTHELQHVVQHSMGLPADAFELELEAHLVQFRVAEELGYAAGRRGTFHWRAYTRFRRDPKAFAVWLRGQYSENISSDGGPEAYIAELLERREKAEAALKRHEKRLASRNAVLERMRATGQPDSAVEQFRLDEVAPVEEQLRVKRRELAWLERDAELLASDEGRARYERYARSVRRKLGRFAR